jgi:hypothetical protein
MSNWASQKYTTPNPTSAKPKVIHLPKRSHQRLM